MLHGHEAIIIHPRAELRTRPGFAMKVFCPNALKALLLFAVLVQHTGCDKKSPSQAAPAGANPSFQSVPERAVPIYTYEVINVWPHDRSAFTQGLIFLDGALLESTGLNGQSSLRKVELQTGAVLQRVDVPSDYFAEGMAVLGDKIFQLTWRNQKAFVYDLETFRLEKEFTYDGEGWGLTTDGRALIMSDGTHQIRFIDPATFKVLRTISVLHQGQPVTRLNELEYIKGEIFANIWGADQVARIDPASGKVTGVIDFAGLLPRENRGENPDVLNGIAYDSTTDRIFVTGKLWPKLFEVRLKLK
jgi:glutamine cyclotransferase